MIGSEISKFFLSNSKNSEIDEMKKCKIEKLPPLPKTSSLLSPDFNKKRAQADAKFNAFEKGFELAEKKSEKD